MTLRPLAPPLVFVAVALSAVAARAAEPPPASGDLATAIVQARQALEAEPGDASRRAGYAQALMDGGLAQAAWEQAGYALAMEPESEEVAATAGGVLLRGLLGDLPGSGWPREKALSALGDARNRAPDNDTVTILLVTARLTNENGVELGAGSDPEAALPDLRRIVEGGRHPELELPLLRALLRTGRFGEILERTADGALDTDALALRLGAAARAEGAAKLDAVAADARKRAPGVVGEAAARAAGEMFRLGDLEGARKLLRIGAVTGALPETGRRLQASLERLATPPPPLDPTDPRSVTRHFAGVTLSEDADSAADALFSRLEGAPSAEQRRRLVGLAGLVAQRVTLGGAAPAGPTLRMLAASMDVFVEGSPEIGWRTRFQSFQEPEMAMDLYLAPPAEPGAPVRWVVWDNGTPWVWSRIGDEALRRLGEGNAAGLAAARQWLDWAAERPARNPRTEPLTDGGFRDLWPVGTPGDADRARAAATLLMRGAEPAAPDGAEDAVPEDELPRYRKRLERRLAGSGFDAEAAARRAWLDLAEGRASAESLALARRAVEARPDDRSLYILAALSAAVGRPEDALDALRRRVETARHWHPDNALVVGLLAERYGELQTAANRYFRATMDLWTLEVGPLDAAMLMAHRLDALEARGVSPGSDG